MEQTTKNASFTFSADNSELKRVAAFLDNWKILSTGETFGQHRKYCDGCPDCASLRRKRQQILHKNEDVAGVAMYKVLGLRAHINHPISWYFPTTKEFYDEYNQIERDFYIYLQLKGFTDDDIRGYFGIKSDDWNDFKNKYFPVWRKKSHEYLSVYADVAIQHYNETHPRQAMALKSEKIARHKSYSSRV